MLREVGNFDSTDASLNEANSIHSFAKLAIKKKMEIGKIELRKTNVMICRRNGERKEEN